MAVETVEKVYAPQPFADARSGVIVAPFQFALTDDDFLRVISVNVAVGAAIAIQGRRLDSAGAIDSFARLHVPHTDRSAAADVFQLGRGALLNLAVFVTGATPLIGQTFVILQIVRGTGAGLVLLGTLLQGYVTSTQGLGWPGSPIASSTEGGGYHRTITGTQPAAGGDVVEFVPTGARWELLRIFLQLTTSATAGTRVPFLGIQQGGGMFFRSKSSTTVAASGGLLMTWAAGLHYETQLDAGWPLFQLPRSNYLKAGDSIQSFATGMAAGDQWAAPIYNVREWLEVP